MNSPNESLLAVRDAGLSLLQENAGLRAQRDTLLAACQAALVHLDEILHAEVIKQCRAAIQKAAGDK